MFIFSGKTFCEHCKKKCSGEVLRVHEKYFHIACFNCYSCKKSLAQGGFFSRDSNFFCTDCYQSKFGQQCATCGKYVEGEVVTALGNTYHQKCFLCARCRQPFPSGERVTYTGKECLCQRCYQIPTVDSESPARSPSSVGPSILIFLTISIECSGCKEELVEGQALIALDQQWHIWCFKCAACNTLLHGEYMGKDGLPYCEKDYQSQFGVKCAYCDRFITGKVLQAGDNHHFHPTCARCTKCGDPFGGWRRDVFARCGPGPTENGTVLNGSLSNGHHVNGESKPERERDFDGLSSTASETQFHFEPDGRWRRFSRSCTPSLNGSLRSCSPYNSLNRKVFLVHTGTCSPGLILREYKSSHSPVDITRIYTYSYLTAEPTQSYLKRPIDPYDKPPKSPHFHRPPMDSRKVSLPKTSSRLGMKVMVEAIQSETPRPKSPKMNNEEPIILSHFPAAKPPVEGQTSRIERADFPAPPYPYTDPERRRRWSGSSKGVSLDETDDGVIDPDAVDDIPPLDPKLKKEEVELSKIATAPSRHMDHMRPWDDEEYEPGSSYRCSTGRSSVTLPSYNVVSSLRGEPKPGYGLKSSTLPATGRNGGPAGMMNNLFSPRNGVISRSSFSASSLNDADRNALNPELCPSATYSSGLRGYSYSPHFRRSLPNMHHMASDPPKIYPAHLLFTTNYRLPNDVDRCHLERHLSDVDFEMVFHMTRMDFYRLPEWRRNDLKRRARLF
ncbi:Actin-binding LIM protein 3 [Armadillidium nasatum]|uniref:Actin-binding LIM protein 3 n=1 Tax=Armadillidium nasatum TaxID=96803 RepID=A0A5N5TJJ7_9CRUS|nr:Actin-binding LIM protein 3 [Armadillidium nasatum]